MKKFSINHFITVSVMLFGMFFGAGNLIFPPLLGKEAGAAVWIAWIGFVTTAILLPVLGVASIAKSGGIQKLAGRVDKVFGYIFTIAIYLAIGPGLAIPRAGSTPFELIVTPYLPADASQLVPRLVYTAVFFALAYWLCLNPSKLMSRMGRITTPSLMALIVLMFVFIMRMDTSSLTEVTGRYQDNAYIGGFLAGYDTMDTLAALVFGLVVANTLRTFNMTSTQMQKTTIGAGITAGLFLGLIYWLLTSIGHATSAQFPDTINGAEILLNSTIMAIGQPGAVLLTVIFSLACLNTCVGLLTSLSEYFSLLLPRFSYKNFLALFVAWSFVTANFGLNAILKISVPVLIFIYPAAIILIVMELTRQWLNYSRKTYQLVIYTVAVISGITALESANIIIPGITQAFNHYLPLYKQQLGWLVPFLILLLICSLFEQISNKRNKLA